MSKETLTIRQLKHQKEKMRKIIISGLLVASTMVCADGYTMAPDGSYVGGDNYTMIPDGSFIGNGK